MGDEERVARWIARGPTSAEAADARLVDSDLAVMTIIGYLAMVGGDVSRVAEDCAVPRQAIEAAAAYYRRHCPAIDARLAAEARAGY